MRARIVTGLFDSIWRKVALWQPPHVTRADVRLAYAVAVATDVAQFLLGPFGWEGFDEVLDAIAMVVVSRLIGGLGEESVTTTLIASLSQTRMRVTPILSEGSALRACWIAFVTSSEAMISASGA